MLEISSRAVNQQLLTFDKTGSVDILDAAESVVLPCRWHGPPHGRLLSYADSANILKNPSDCWFVSELF